MGMSCGSEAEVRGQSTTDAVFALRVQVEKVRGQKCLYRFRKKRKAFDGVSGEELWLCMRQEWQKSM